MGGFSRWFGDTINTTDKFLIKTMELIKKRWLKADKVKMQELLKKKQETEKQREDAWKLWMKLSKRERKIEKEIENLNKKYTYIKKYKVDNPHYKYDEAV